MRAFPIALLATISAFSVGCEQPQQPVTPPDTTAVLDSVGWEPIELVPGAYSAAAMFFNDSGMIVGAATYSNQFPQVEGFYFIYENGQLRRLVGGDNGTWPSVISSSGLIVGLGDWQRMVAVWDSPDAMPRRLEPGLSPDEDIVGMVGVNDQGDIIAGVSQDSHCDGLGPRHWYDCLGGPSAALLWRTGVRQNLGYLAEGPLEEFGHPDTHPAAMNERGQIVGSSKVAVVVHRTSPPHGVYHPFLWENGVMRDLGVLAPFPCTDVETPMDCSSAAAIAINEQGVVLGYSTGADGVQRAVIWENGAIRDLGAFPGKWVTPLAINDRSQVLAVVFEAPGVSSTSHVFLWDHGQIQTVMRADQAEAKALGPHGEVIGYRIVDNVQRAWVWEAGTLTELGPGVPDAINSRGDIIGGFHHGDGTHVAILWRKKR